MVDPRVSQYVYDLCHNSNNQFGAVFLDQHIRLVADYSAKLAELIGGNKEAIELAAYLHDTAAIADYSTLPRHAQAGAEMAADVLADFGYSPEIIELTTNAIANHPNLKAIGSGSLETVCISNADSMSQIVNPSYWLYYAFTVLKLSYEDGVNWYTSRMLASYNNIIPQAQEMVAERYQVVKRIFN